MVNLVTKNGTLVLLARIVDNAGAIVCPSAVATIAYSLYELDVCGKPIPVDRQIGVPVDVDDALRDELVIDDAWSLDPLGYNFRHELELYPIVQNLLRTGRYRLIYEFTSAAGQTHFIKFELKGTMRCPTSSRFN
jgi:hypothetical protein